jgi:thiol-disulfide isomerase/thioredoxin
MSGRGRRLLVMAAALGLASSLSPARTESAAPSRKAEPVNIVSIDQLRTLMNGHRGRVLVLHLWATWCTPCLQELPLVGALAREAPARGVDLLSVSLDDPTPRAAETVARILRQRGSAAMSRTILRVDDPDALVASIDPRWEGEIPAFFAYDREGHLRHAQVGEMTRVAFDELVGDLVAAPAVKK